MPSSIAYLLVFHGSPDPRPQAAVTGLAQLFHQKIQHAGLPFQPVQLARSPQTNECLVDTAYLECGPLPLHTQIEQFAQRFLSLHPAISPGQPLQIKILPLFLLAGVHVMEDIPAEVRLAQQALEALGTPIELEICAYLGCHPGLHRLMTERIARLPVEAWVLLAHGSRRVGANQPIEALAERLGAVPAYWSVSPKLESRLQELIQLGLRKVAILPFFLFSGGITDAIAQAIEEFSQRFPALDLHLTAPLESSPELADLLVDLAQERSWGTAILKQL